MIELEFRAFDKRRDCEHRMYDVIAIYPSKRMLDIGFVANRHWGTRQRSFEEVELMQFTGMLDRNGKKVFEGDNVSGRTSGEVEFAYGGWCVRGSSYVDLFSDTTVEVVGNKWEM